MLKNKPKPIQCHKIKTRSWILKEAGIVLESEVTKLKLINRVGEVWSARTPPAAADALPSSPTLPGKQGFADSQTSLLVSDCHPAFFLLFVWKLYRRVAEENFASGVGAPVKSYA